MVNFQKKHLHLHPETFHEFQVLITLCLQDNICSSEGKLTDFLTSFSWAGALCTLVADLFMNDIDDQILTSGIGTKHVRYYTRYVDDILCSLDCRPNNN